MGVGGDNFVSKVVGCGNDARAYDVVEIMVWLATADQRVTAEPGITRYLEEIRRAPMLEPHEEHMLAKRWREHGDHEAAHKLVNSHLRLVARIATGYRGYGLPISELISEGQYRSDAGGQALRAGQGNDGRTETQISSRRWR